MSTYGKYLNTTRRFRIPNGIKYLYRTKHTITHNPKANPNGTLYVRVPKLAQDVLLFPASVCVFFDLTVKGHANNHTRNNLGRIIVSKMSVKFRGECLFDLNHYNVFKTYCDLFMKVNKKEQSVYQGISNLKLRKLRSVSGYAQNTGTEGNLLFMIPLDFGILTDHAPFYLHDLAEDLVFEFTLAPATEVIFRGTESATRDYELTNIALDYKTVRSDELDRAVSSTYLSGVTMFYDYVTVFKELTIPLNETLTNININVPRKIYKGILMLCFDVDRKHSEELKTTE